MSDEKQLRTVFSRTMLASAVFLLHLASAALAITGIWLFDLYCQRALGIGELKFFGHIPVSWVFDASELAVLSISAFWGVVEANSVLRQPLRPTKTSETQPIPAPSERMEGGEGERLLTRLSRELEK